MQRNSEPTTPVDAYKGIIDQLVRETSASIAERLVRESGRYSNAPDDGAMNEFVASLSQPQRELLAKMLGRQRVCAIHDVLAAMTWWLQCRDVALTFRGEAMPVELSGMGLHGDYLARLDGWEWPSMGKTC
ncbi:MAG: hypothetical protein K2X32_09790 [Phycisphaerales bacterium]|nr:hypothetical protein [Phycisphaerales bacterium]